MRYTPGFDLGQGRMASFGILCGLFGGNSRALWGRCMEKRFNLHILKMYAPLYLCNMQNECQTCVPRAQVDRRDVRALEDARQLLRVRAHVV